MKREYALSLFKKYNKGEFLLRHAFTVEGVMREFAKEEGYDEEFWGVVGLLHDIDYEMWPMEHCQKAPELLKEGGASEELIHAVISHGYEICADVKPTHRMEKLLYASDELTGLIWSASLMRPSKSTKDMDIKSVKKKYKDKKFAQGVDREIVKRGAEMLGITLDELFELTLIAMKNTEDWVKEEMALQGF